VLRSVTQPLLRSVLPHFAAPSPGAAPPGLDKNPFAGFWMGGYEGADHVNGSGQPLDMVRDSGHWARLEEDHRRAAQAGLRCVRESIGWRLSEDAQGRMDLSRALRVQASARRHGLQVLWTLMHYGVPEGLCLHDDRLVPRLARFAAEVARVLGPGDGPHPPVFTPVNEISFLAWAASQSNLLHPPNRFLHDPSEAGELLARQAGYAVKRRLAKAALAAMAAIRSVLAHARFLHVEPLVHVVHSAQRPDLAAQAQQMNAWQWQALDLIAGRLEPALGGSPYWLDVVGVNHYAISQWEFDTGKPLDWAAQDPRRRPVRHLLADAWQRYRRPLVMAETGHVGQGRAAWLHDMAHEVRSASAAGVPVMGLCLYPLVDRPDWNEPTCWHRSGVWHVDQGLPARPRRAEPDTLAALAQWQKVLPQPLPPKPSSPARVLLAFLAHRWDWPHHGTRMALEAFAKARPGWRVVVVDEPRSAPQARLDCIPCAPNLEVLVPYLPEPLQPAGGSGVPLEPAPYALMQPLLSEWLQAHGIAGHTTWLCTPLAAPLARSLGSERVLDEHLENASERLGALGAAISSAPGPLRIHCGVDTRLFKPRWVELDTPLSWHDEEAALAARPVCSASGPQLGYAGAIDPCLDLTLLAELAEQRPDWQFVMAGPLLGVDPASVPRRPNLHWLGRIPPRVLPSLMARWQVLLLPVVQGSTLASAQPTAMRQLQVLEALAMGLPVVAPPWLDLPQAFRGAGVVEPQVLHAGSTGDATACSATAFLAACQDLLAEEPATRSARQRRARQLACRYPRVAAVRWLAGALETSGVVASGAGDANAKT
jgi:glycosyltransferase involved in cell wall biosynthesis